jgi:predicted permease
MILNSLFPVFALIVAGSLMKHFGLTTDAFLKVSDRLTYFIFFPALLFLKIGSASSAVFSSSGLYKAVIVTVLTVYVLSTLFIKLGKVADSQAGSFSQSCYRFNTYIGVAIVVNALNDQGVQYFMVLLGLIIPIINVLSVSTLTWFSEEKVQPARRLVQTVRAIATNPLILSCLAGMVYAHLWDGFPAFIEGTLKLASFVALPLALISIGGALTLRGIKKHFRLALIASLFKLLALPAVGYLLLKAFGVSQLGFKVGMIYFALPTSTALYVLSAQLNSDTELASAAIALSTLLSFFSLSIALVA